MDAAAVRQVGRFYEYDPGDGIRAVLYPCGSLDNRKLLCKEGVDLRSMFQPPLLPFLTDAIVHDEHAVAVHAVDDRLGNGCAVFDRTETCDAFQCITEGLALLAVKFAAFQYRNCLGGKHFLAVAFYDYLGELLAFVWLHLVAELEVAVQLQGICLLHIPDAVNRKHVFAGRHRTKGETPFSIAKADLSLDLQDGLLKRTAFVVGDLPTDRVGLLAIAQARDATQYSKQNACSVHGLTDFVRMVKGTGYNDALSRREVS